MSQLHQTIRRHQRHPVFRRRSDDVLLISQQPLPLLDPHSSADQPYPSLAEQAEKGGTGTGFEGDFNGLIYFGSPEHNAINVYDPSTLQASVSVRDPRIIFPDSLAVTPDGYLHFTVN